MLSDLVEYINQTQFDVKFEDFINNIRINKNFIINLGKKAVSNYVFELFQSFMLCTKHPGFHEEREWRIIYIPRYKKSDHIMSCVHSIGGVPQPICKIPLADIPNEGLIGIEIPSLINRLIIGPTQYPRVIKDAFIELLKSKDVKDAENKVIISDIPLRN